ncbi:MAG: beta-ketoacyl synthase N-terminal-like domain-containing protein [Mucilaginibacter sp.]
MSGVFVAADNITSPIGPTTGTNFAQLKKGISGVKLHTDTALGNEPFYAALFNKDQFTPNNQYTKFEQLLIASITDALANCEVDATDKKTALIISTTKGNISLLETGENNEALKKRIALPTSAKLVAAHFGFVNRPVIISNACISGIMAILTGMRLIQSGQYENVVVAGADEITKFVLSGFQSFQAISNEPCKPFDADRTGITLGEGAATVILSSNPKYADGVKVLAGAVSNDANHISAPSRTGEELGFAITKTLKQAYVNAHDVDFISAHGTATSYNDEMEAKAIAFAGLQNIPTNSLKGFYGHTLGAAGLIESIISMQSLKENVVLPTLGFNSMGVSAPLNICTTLLQGNYTTFMKTASGFGGCNAAVLFSKT